MAQRKYVVGKAFDPKKLSVKDKIKHAAKPDVIKVPIDRRLPARNRPGYRKVRVGHNIQYRKITGPTEAKVDTAIAKLRARRGAGRKAIKDKLAAANPAEFWSKAAGIPPHGRQKPGELVDVTADMERMMFEQNVVKTKPKR